MMESSDAVELDSNPSDQYVQTIKTNLENGQKNRVSDIVAFQASMKTIE